MADTQQPEEQMFRLTNADGDRSEDVEECILLYALLGKLADAIARFLEFRLLQ